MTTILDRSDYSVLKLGVDDEASRRSVVVPGACGCVDNRGGAMGDKPFGQMSAASPPENALPRSIIG